MEQSDVVSLSAEIHEELDVSRSQVRRGDAEAEQLQRRITYFMVFRLAVVLLLVLVLGSVVLQSDHETLPFADVMRGAAILGSFTLSLVFALLLRPKREVLLEPLHLRRIAWVQSAFDWLFATWFAVFGDGLGSDFVFLYPIAILGAATMGHRRQIVTISAMSVVSFVVVTASLYLSIPEAAQRGAEVWLTGMRGGGVIVLFALLSNYLNTLVVTEANKARGLRTFNENILRSLSSGLLTIDQQGTVLFANPTAGQLLGQAGSLYERDCEELLPGLRDHLGDSGGLRHRFELEITRPDDNRQIMLGLSCSTLLDEDAQFLGHIVNFQDVTELREMETVVRRSERLAAVGALAASVAHEVRNPLAAISGCAELLDTSEVNEEDQRLIKVIRSETARLADIVTELLDYTRERQLVRTRIDLAQALLELGDNFRADPSNAEVEIVVDVPKRVVSVELDVSQLTQVLWNLVRNGAQAMEGKGKLVLELRDHRRDRVEIDVRDEGVGIPAEDLERVFEPFFSTKSGGTGIGLALVHRIIDEHGGVIRVDSTPGEGTTFTVTLPRRAPDELSGRS